MFSLMTSSWTGQTRLSTISGLHIQTDLVGAPAKREKTQDWEEQGVSWASPLLVCSA